MSDANEPMTQLVSAVFQRWIGAIESALRDAADAGELKLEVGPLVLARHIVAAIEGGIMMSRLTKNGEHLLDCLDSIRVVLGIAPSAGPPLAPQSPSLREESLAPTRFV